MTISEHTTLNAALRNDFGVFVHRCFLTLNPGIPFLHNWHLEALAHQLEEISNGQATRVIINMPPRALKSVMVSVAYVAFLLGHNPRRRIFVISYSTELANKHAEDFRNIVTSDWYRRAFPKMRISRLADGDIFTTDKGFRKSTSVNATLTGLGGDLFIIDDPLKPADAMSEAVRNRVNDWVSNTLVSRLDNKMTGQILVVMQRVHQQDLTGHLLEHSVGWKHFCLPSIATEDKAVPLGAGRVYRRKQGEALHAAREPLHVLENVRREIGTDQFQAQYQQQPVPPGGAMVRKEWFRYYETAPERSLEAQIVISWDTAAKDGPQNDWSVSTVWLIVERKHFYLLSLKRARYEYPKLRQEAIAQAERWHPNRILIEDASTGIALAQELTALQRFAIKKVPVERDKVGRLYVQTHKFEAGQVFFPRHSAFMKDVEAELLTFPQGRHDDIVDSISQVLAHGASGYDTSQNWAL